MMKSNHDIEGSVNVQNSNSNVLLKMSSLLWFIKYLHEKIKTGQPLCVCMYTRYLEQISAKFN